MFELIKILPSKSNAKKRRGLTDMDYVPKEALPQLELVLYGTPIQPETEPFFTSQLFSTIVHFYSEQDYIQQLDWVSTKNFYSNQRINPYVFKANTKKHSVVQCKIMYNNALTDAKNKDASSKESESVWSKIFSTNSIFFTKSKDPSHKEMWFFPWRDESKNEQPYLWPLPTVIFTPILTSLVKKVTTSYDIDLNVVHDSTSLRISLAHHNTGTIQEQASLPSSLISTIKDSVKLWKPENFTEKTSFNSVYKHLMQTELFN